MKHLIVTAICFCIWFTWNTAFSAFEPTLSTDIALQQMEDTTQGHEISRAYFQRMQPLARSPLFPAGICGALLLGAYWPRKTQQNKKEGR